MTSKELIPGKIYVYGQYLFECLSIGESCIVNTTYWINLNAKSFNSGGHFATKTAIYEEANSSQKMQLLESIKTNYYTDPPIPELDEILNKLNL